MAVAPLSEQERIVDKLDALMERLDVCRDIIDRVPTIIKHLRQSVLTAAISGKLTEEWRAEMSVSIEKTWAKTKLKNIATDISYGYTASSTDSPKGPKMLRITDIQNNKVDWSTVPYCEISNKKHNYFLKHGDLVFARTGATVGKSFLIWGEIPEAVFASYLIRVRCKAENSIEYLSIFFKSNAYWAQITEFSSGVAQPSVNGTKLKELVIPLPSTLEQHEIVRQVNALFAYADRLEDCYTEARTQIEKLTPAMLSKAYQGKLVPQNPKDEPASELVQRIKLINSVQAVRAKRVRTTDSAFVPKKTIGENNMTKSRNDDDVKNQPYLASHLLNLGGHAYAETLFKVADLPVADFYKQLAWEVKQGMVVDNNISLGLPNASR